MDFVGKTSRFADYHTREIKNLSFQLYLNRMRIALPTAYRRPVFKKRERTWLRSSFSSAGKYAKPQPAIDKIAMAIATLWGTVHFGKHMSGAQVLSAEEALTGMDKQTACGTPLNELFHSKAEALADPRAVAFLEEYFENHCKDPVIWTNSLKDEIRSILKLYSYTPSILVDKIRTFTGSSFEHTLALNRLCAHMNNKMYDSAGKTFSFVGATNSLEVGTTSTGAWLFTLIAFALI